MATSIDAVAQILEQAEIRFDFQEDQVVRSIWMRDDIPVTLLLVLLEDGELLQLRVPGLLSPAEDDRKPLMFRAMLQMAYEMRLVQFEYDAHDGDLSTCIDIVLEDGELTAQQLLRCCSILLEVSFLARDRLKTILETGHDPALDADDVDEDEAKERQSQLDVMVDLAQMLRNTKGDA